MSRVPLTLNAGRPAREMFKVLPRTLFTPLKKKPVRKTEEVRVIFVPAPEP